MAVTGYPKVSISAWRTLRARVANAPSTRFTPGNVAAMLGMANADSARDNVVSPIRRLGLIDEDGSLTPLGQKWRVDASYGDACQEIIDAIYPDELATLSSGDGVPDMQQVKTWFDHRGFGGSNARNMAATYVMIASKRIPEPQSSEPRKAAKTAPIRKAAAAPAPAAASASAQAKATEAAAPHQTVAPPARAPGNAPNVHLDIQIHIPVGASPDQIDHIFASMAKHLYGRDEER